MIKVPCIDCSKLIKKSYYPNKTGRCLECWWKYAHNPESKHHKTKLCPICKTNMMCGTSRTCISCCPTKLNCTRGPDNPAWKGGITHKNGYVLIRKPDHIRANKGYVTEHIIRWEESHGQSLPDGWVIHHLNGIRDDNRATNLVALPDRKHKNVLTAKSKRIQELEALLKTQGQLL